jgi:hypothetical protein
MTVESGESQAVKNARKYLRRIRDRDLEVIPASEWGEGWNLMQYASRSLSHGMDYFTRSHSQEATTQFRQAYDEALTCGLLREGKGLFTKVEALEAENKGLKDVVEKLFNKCPRCGYPEKSLQGAVTE